ncbi:MAG: exopolyphosphatase [Ketobacteraceae bacterium]|nr:exopolyphosphatase [Ketobacteraceae bacterium]
MKQRTSKEVPEGQVMAAIDMGSNSFHMVVARLESGEIRLLQKFGEKVRMAAGLDENNCLTGDAMERGLDCLKRFAQRADNIEPGWLRCIGTNTLRKARNGGQFIRKAEKVLGCPVEVVAGREEARLIYLGVSHSLPSHDGRRLVFDIGGGSTEFVIGEKFEPLLTESLHMGCVGYQERFFPGGDISEWHFFRAVMAVRRELVAIEAAYRNTGWEQVVGASGTVKAVHNAVVESGLGEGITRQSLQKLTDKVLAFKNTDELDIPGVKSDRAPVFPSGLAIITGIMEELDIDEVHYSDGALREGVLYDMLGRLEHENVCERTIHSMMKRYSVDTAQAERVQQTALQAFDQARKVWDLDSDHYRELLSWAALVHEIGVVISHSGFHKHGAYVLQHADMAGFSKQEQTILAVLVASHRRKVRQPLFDELPESVRLTALKLCLLLRIAVILHRSRLDQHLPSFLLEVDDTCVTLMFPDQWLEEHPLTRGELQQEIGNWEKAGFSLEVK